ncbi:MAG: BCCT family transporter [Ornithinimicrobium sp.]
MRLVRQGGADSITTAVGDNVATALFVMLDELPLSLLTSLVAIFLVSVFFITSADSASFVLASMSTGGALNPPTWVKLVWGAVIASFAGVLLLAGGLDALQKVAIIAAVPFALIMIAMCFSLYLALLKEPKPDKEETPVIEDLGDRLKENMPGRTGTGAKE